MPVKKSKVKSPASAPPSPEATVGQSKASAGKQKLAGARITKKASGLPHRGPSVDVYNVKGKAVGKVSLPKELFGADINPVLMAQAVRVYLANQRKGTASTKTRGQVIATTAKVWRQKGTGRARHGAKSAPIWVGGGVVFGPKPRDYSLSLPKKMKRSALASALTSKAKDQAIVVVEGLEKLEPKTKIMFRTLETLTKNPSTSLRASKILLIIPDKVENVQRSARNIEGVTIRPANLLTTYEALNNDILLFMKDSIKKLEETWINKIS